MLQLPTKELAFAIACSWIGYAARKFDFCLERPVFIVGTGRCGTNLLVRILNSHPDIAGYPGEANELWHPKLEPFESATIDIPPIEVDPRRFSEVSIGSWPSGQAERIRNAFTGYTLLHRRSRVFFTKSAMISFMIPKILEVFPEARFIHIYRFGPAVVESYFKKNFGKYSKHNFREEEYRLHCARYWNACVLEIERRSKERPLSARGAFMQFSYEMLCDLPWATLRAAASFLEVDPGGFSFDLSRIANRNRDLGANGWWQEDSPCMRAMSAGLRLMGYCS
jgi:hypothetical protein